jgi:hypothetical protein
MTIAQGGAFGARWALLAALARMIGASSIV